MYILYNNFCTKDITLRFIQNHFAFPFRHLAYSYLSLDMPDVATEGQLSFSRGPNSLFIRFFCDLQSVTKYVDRLGRDCNKSPHPPLFNVVGRKLTVQLLSFVFNVLYCVPDRFLRTYGNIEMGEGGLQVVFAISCKNNLSDVSVPPFNVTDCLSILQHGYCT